MQDRLSCEIHRQEGLTLMTGMDQSLKWKNTALPLPPRCPAGRLCISALLWKSLSPASESFFIMLLKLKCAYQSTGCPFKMYIPFQLVWDSPFLTSSWGWCSGCQSQGPHFAKQGFGVQQEESLTELSLKL